MNFLRSLEAFCAPERLHIFRQHPITVEFRGKWGLHTYFLIRFQELASRLQEVLAEPPTLLSSTSNGVSKDSFNDSHGISSSVLPEHQFMLSSSRMLWICLHRAWSKEVWLSDLTQRFFKLTLELLQRFISSVRGGCHTFSDSFSHVSLPLLNNGISNNQNTANLPSNKIWRTVPVHTLLYVRVDLHYFASFVREELSGVLIDSLVRCSKHV